MVFMTASVMVMTQVNVNDEWHTAIYKGDKKKVADLIAKGADVNAQIKEGYHSNWTPLHLSASEGNAEIV